MAAGLLFTMVFFVRPHSFFWSRDPADVYSYQIIMFSDLECDYINPIDLCNKLNQVCIFRYLFCIDTSVPYLSLFCRKTLRTPSSLFFSSSLANG